MSSLPVPHLLVVDDDAAVRELVQEYLGHNDFRVTGCATGTQLMDAFRAGVVDLVLLDLRLRGEDGMQLLRQLRAESQIPVIILTGRAEEADRVMGLELGADDYLTKPFSPRELLARIRTVLRRAPQSRTPPLPRAIRFGDCVFEIERQFLTRSGVPIRLTSTEAGLLRALALAAGTPLSREDLSESTGQSRTVDVQVTRLRRKIEADPKFPRYLQTVRGKGYVLLTD